MRRILVILVTIMSGRQAAAAKIIGNGGMVVKCGEGTQQVQLLDFYEAENLHYDAKNMVPLTMSDPEGLTYRDKVYSLIARISSRFPGLARAISEEFSNFERHNLILPNVDLGSTDDDFHSVLPKGCHIEQAAIQRAPMFPRDAWFTISKDLWDALDERGKAGLALHEVVYRLGVKNGLQHSIGVRYLVGLLFSNEIDQVSDQDWISALLQSRIKNYELQGLTIPLFTGEFRPCERLPGSTNCMDSPETFKAAEVRYDSLGRIQQITYPDMSENVTCARPYGVSFSLRVRDLRFDWSREELNLLAEGEMALLSAGQLSVDAVTLRVNGRIQVTSEQFSGSETVLDTDGNPLDSPREYIGALQNMLAPSRARDFVNEATMWRSN
jgi:hypothetical protein